MAHDERVLDRMDERKESTHKQGNAHDGNLQRYTLPVNHRSVLFLARLQNDQKV
uniref:Uncharacterized protein n=1 Tax=Candidatus Kentrum sp. FW TaxID=2126338 RepID=A0A450U0H9_9GAMM|nr:MAG: hypothetical protein BECKFW1821C_GA0114237_10895 [Candidatus Kentron sp. FW]